jgi:hypothetical protein
MSGTGCNDTATGAGGGAWGCRASRAPPARPARTYEGTLLFVTGISCNYRDSPYKRERGRQNDRGPSSEPACALAMSVPAISTLPQRTAVSAGLPELRSEKNAGRSARSSAALTARTPPRSWAAWTSSWRPSIRRARASGWPKRRKLAHVFLWEHG